MSDTYYVYKYYFTHEVNMYQICELTMGVDFRVVFSLV